MAALARSKLSTSTRVMTMSSPDADSLPQATTYSPPCAPSRTLKLLIDKLTLPALSRTPVIKASESRDINPLPQMPFGLPPPLTPFVGSQVSLLIHTSSIAPCVARIPLTTPAPSNAGPAEHAHVTSQSRLPSTVSPLVPTSRKSVTSSATSTPDDNTPAVMSAPT